MLIDAIFPYNRITLGCDLLALPATKISDNDPGIYKRRAMRSDADTLLLAVIRSYRTEPAFMACKKSGIRILKLSTGFSDR